MVAHRSTKEEEAQNDPGSEISKTPRDKHVQDTPTGGPPAKRPGGSGAPILASGSWGTVREDYSQDGNAWNYFNHDLARSRAYHWGEDGLAGISDDKQFAVLQHSVVEQGKVTARIVSELLEGKKPEAIPIETLPRKFMFDWNELERWHISEKVLPSGSIVLFRKPGIWERTEWIWTSAFLVILGLSVLAGYCNTAENN